MVDCKRARRRKLRFHGITYNSKGASELKDTTWIWICNPQLVTFTRAIFNAAVLVNLKAGPALRGPRYS